MTVVALREPESGGLELLEQAKALLAAATSVDDVKDIRDRAEALRSYAKQAGLGLEAQNRAAEVKLRAERRAGELLAEMELEPGRPEKSSHRARISDLGLTYSESSRWQRVASLPEDVFEDYIDAAIDAGREVTTAGALKLAKQYREPAADDPLPPLGEGIVRTITADPPWRYGNTSTRGAAQDHYNTLSIEQLTGEEELPEGGNLAEQVKGRTADTAHLYLWTTAGHLPEAFKVMEAWGFTYKTYLVWVKPQMGMGNYFRVSTELVLFGVKGGLRTNDRSLMNWFEAKRGQHSAKPEVFHDLVMKASPGPYLEMFARCRRDTQLICRCTRCRLGWETWGNEA